MNHDDTTKFSSKVLYRDECDTDYSYCMKNVFLAKESPTTCDAVSVCQQIA